MISADVIFEIRRGKRGRIASLTVAVDADTPVDQAEQEIGKRLAAECARHGFGLKPEIHVEAQANWLTGGLDATATAYVRTIRAHTSRRAERRAPAGRRVVAGAA